MTKYLSLLKVLLPEDVSAAVEYSRSSLPLSSPSLDGLVKCSLFRECHVTSVPPSWYSESHDHHLSNLYENNCLLSLAINKGTLPAFCAVIAFTVDMVHVVYTLY